MLHQDEAVESRIAEESRWWLRRLVGFLEPHRR
jgi:hypothetical protein